MDLTIEGLKDSLAGLAVESKRYCFQIWSQIPSSQVDLERYFSQIKSILKADILHDVSNLKLSPITITIAISTLTSALILLSLVSSATAKPKRKSKSKSKSLTKAQRANRDIERILDHVASEYATAIDAYIDTHSLLSPDDVAYKYKYFEEMLLKELMKLDAIDVFGNDVLKGNRKKVILFIQEYQKRLDAFKKEQGF